MHLSLSFAKENMAEKEMGGGSQEGDCLLLTGHGGYDKFKVVQREATSPNVDEVLVEVYACGLNFADLMARQGLYDRCPKLPGVLGMEASGVVLEAGKSVTNVKVGDRIALMSGFGLWQGYVTIKAEQCFVIPDKMTFEEAASMCVNYITAYQMLYDFGGLRPNKSVLIHMAAGGVGIAATQLCKAEGNVTTFGTASAAKHDVIREEGITHPIDYRTKDFEEEVRRISPAGVDIVLNPFLGAEAKKGYQLLRPLGKIIYFGAANMVKGENRSLWQVASTYLRTSSHNPMTMMNQNRGVCGYHLGHLAAHVDLLRDVMMNLLQLYSDGKIKPRVDSVWHFDDVGKAMGQMHERRNIGKVILTPKKSVAEAFKPRP